MRKESNHFAIPPWSHPLDWEQVHLSIKQTVSCNWFQFKGDRERAKRIAGLYSNLNECFETLCSETCVRCEDICCQKATVWYDFKDLLFLYCFKGELPREQIYKKDDLFCCNLTPNGCRLHRTKRPFICTWYTCPAQTDLFRDTTFSESAKKIQASLQEIKLLRNCMAESFMKNVLSK